MVGLGREGAQIEAAETLDSARDLASPGAFLFEERTSLQELDDPLCFVLYREAPVEPETSLQ